MGYLQVLLHANDEKHEASVVDDVWDVDEHGKV